MRLPQLFCSPSSTARLIWRIGFGFIATGAAYGWLRLYSQTTTAARGQSRPARLLKKQGVEIEAHKGVSLQRSLASCIELAKLWASFSENSEL
jgi:hypothetical protein